MKKIPLLLAICIGCLLGCTNQKESTSPKYDGAWHLLSSEDGSEPIERHEAAFTRVGEKLFLLSGRGMRPISIYDIATKSWSEGSQPPLEMHHFQPVIYKEKIYVIGALTGGYPDETPVPHVYIYDPAADSWTKGHEIPEDRQRGSTGNILYQNRIYVACGIKNGHIGDHKNWLDVYDPETGTWEKLADAPRSRDHFQAEQVGGKIYMLGGRLSKANENIFGNTVDTVDVFDLKTQSWSSLKNPLPTPRAGNFVIYYENEIWVMGGESDQQELAHNEVEALNLRLSTWQQKPPLVEGRHGTGAVMYENKILIASGCGKRGGEPELKSMELYMPDSSQAAPFLLK